VLNYIIYFQALIKSRINSINKYLVIGKVIVIFLSFLILGRD